MQYLFKKVLCSISFPFQYVLFRMQNIVLSFTHRATFHKCNLCTMVEISFVHSFYVSIYVFLRIEYVQCIYQSGPAQVMVVHSSINSQYEAISLLVYFSEISFHQGPCQSTASGKLNFTNVSLILYLNHMLSSFKEQTNVCLLSKVRQ